MVPGMAPGMGASTVTSTGTVPDMKQLLVLRVLVQVSVCTSMGTRREPGQNSNDSGTLKVSKLLVPSPL